MKQSIYNKNILKSEASRRRMQKGESRQDACAERLEDIFVINDYESEGNEPL